MKSSEGVIIAVDFGSISLIEGGTVIDSRPIAGTAFHTLKVFAHLPLGAVLAADETGASMADYRRRIDDATAALEELEQLTVEETDLCRELARRTSAFLTQAALRRLSAAEIDEFARSVAPSMRSTARAAARRFIGDLHRAVSSWESRYLTEGLHQVRGVVHGVHQARRFHAATQYLASRFGCGDGLGLPGEGPRVVFAEYNRENPFYSLLGTVLLDRELAERFFGDAGALTVDILAEGARSAIADLGLPTRPCTGA